MSNTLVRNTREHVVADDVPAEAILQSAVELGDDYDVTATREAVIDVLAHMLSARFRGHLTNARHIPKPRDIVVREVGARWGTTKLGEYAIRRQTSVTYDHVRPASRIKPYGPLSKITAEDLNAIQDACLFGMCDGSSAGESAEPGAHWIQFQDVNGGGGSVTLLDDSIDWRDRFVLVATRYSTNDIRPGQSNDHDFNSDTEKIAFGYTGTGGSISAPTGYEIEIATNVAIYATATGALRLGNNNGAASYYTSGLIIASQDLGER